MADDAIMRWENEGGALPSAGSPALQRQRPVAAHTKTDALEPHRSDSFRAEAVSGQERDVRGPPSAPAA
jgi:hypothetical protein